MLWHNVVHAEIAFARVMHYEMTLDQPPQTSEYEPIAVEQQDSLVDRILIRIGDTVIRHFTFLVFITIMWGIFILVLFGGIALVYSVAQSFRELEGREQQRQILHEQQMEQLIFSPPEQDQDSADWDDSEWFVVLNETVSAADDAGQAEISDHPLGVNVAKQPIASNHRLILIDQIWQVDCGDAGLVFEDPYPCPIANISLLEVEDPTVSN